MRRMYMIFGAVRPPWARFYLINPYTDDYIYLQAHTGDGAIMRQRPISACARIGRRTDQEDER